jgi:UDP-glucose 4-epimerase
MLFGQQDRSRESALGVPYLPGDRHCLILGGCGFLGRHIAILLAGTGRHVVLADRAAPTWEIPSPVEDRITWRHLDMSTAEWDVIVHDSELIYHCAWSTIPLSANADPAADLVANVMPTLKLLEALRRQAQPVTMVFLSSGGTVYGKLQRIPVHEDHPLNPISAYGAGKAAGELYCGIYRDLYGVDCRIARLSNPFGAGQNPTRGQGAATVFLHRALSNQTIEIWGDGEVIRDYLHVSDAVAGLVALGCAPRTNGPHIFNIGSGQGVSLNGIVAELSALLEQALDVHYHAGRAFDVPVSILDVKLAKDVLGWSTSLTFSAGMLRTLSDLRRGARLSTLHDSC